MTQKILIAEDDAAVAKVLMEMIAREGHDVVWVPDGAQALTRAGAENFDAAVLDLHMPGMNGIAVAELLKTRTRQMKVVLISGMITESTKQSAAALKGVTLLSKPVSQEALAAALAGPAPRAPAWDVLVVEDYEPLRNLVSGYLYAEGWNVVAVADGHAALREAARRRAKAAVVDLNVPGPHGAELIRRLIEADPTLYIVMMTGEATNPEVTRGYRAGARALIRKPFQTRDLIAALKGREREIDDYRKIAVEKERVESLPGWKRAVHETRTFTKEARQGKHRARIINGIGLAAAFVVSLAIGWAIDAVQNMKGSDAPHESPPSVEKQFIPMVFVHEGTGSSPSKPSDARVEFERNGESFLKRVEPEPRGSTISDADLRRMMDLVARERR